MLHGHLKCGASLAMEDDISMLLWGLICCFRADGGAPWPSLPSEYTAGGCGPGSFVAVQSLSLHTGAVLDPLAHLRAEAEPWKGLDS